ncbi:AmmeMemoRadiSam system radical SAM enzyme [Methanococcoides methylutens]|uniref:Pyruvate formate lyase-activating enzyme 1 n=1 Tax=Methanococcoides methylutens MM1 TaxID=1434104 RepID=A0A0E3WZB5_METMT|nr:AmmeMemoRadiSam system radical SAM enzyme [Methanococcoides methylutens]AKB84599.1 pyruvate formate lyase-activating enzyme 1 [Methanococcoides methylutens MM1]
MLKEAMFYEKLDEGKVQCNLCNHRCKIGEGKTGICGVRENRDGTLYSLIYNTVSSEAVDPIEKKPLFHFNPGSKAYSLGTIGCNFRCKHCQNWTISQVKLDEAASVEITPEEAVSRALATGCRSIAWTYNEPTIWYEYTYDSAKLAKEAGLDTVYVTNGFITPEALKHISPYLDAFRVDIKAFTEDFYRKVASARLAPVLESAKLAKELGMHVEVINLIIPTLNDSEDELRQLSTWVYENLGADTPIHFTRFQPHYKMKHLPPTSVETIEMAHDIAIDVGLKYVYVGNVFGHKYESTYCPSCGELLIGRGLFDVSEYNINPENKCRNCGEPINIYGGFGGL